MALSSPVKNNARRHFIDSKFQIPKAVIFTLCVCLVASDFPPKLDWWHTTVIYQIYPRSFKDSNGDGIGDLKGIEEQLSYFKDMGVKTIWLSPVYKSPMLDMGYDISNFTDIDPLFGTMADFDSLVRRVKELDLKILMDFVPNHSSDECEWFQKSIKKIHPYTDYYVWRDPKGWTDNGTVPIPPNNWVSVFQGPAWDYHPERKQFYLHQFAAQQPDFNYRSPNLVEEIKNTLKFWLDKGVDGFRVDSIMYLYEDASFPDEKVITNKTVRVITNGTAKDYPEYYTAVNHAYTINQPETFSIGADFRALLDSYSRHDGHTRVMLTEAYTTLQQTLRYYGTPEAPIGHFPFNFFLIKLNFTSKAEAFRNAIDDWLKHEPMGAWPNWVLGNHDNHRITTRFTPELVDGMNMLNLLLPGTCITYQGEEIGLEDNMKIRWEQTTDIQALTVGESEYQLYSRDPERTPFQWNNSSHAGFSSTKDKTWLPVHPNYYSLNVENQKLVTTSHLNIYKALTRLRNENEVIQRGALEMIPTTEWVLSFKRSLPDHPESFLIVINLNNEEEYVIFRNTKVEIPTSMTVFVASENSEHKVWDELSTAGDAGFKMRPYSALVLKSPSTRDSHEAQPYAVHSESDGSQNGISVALFLLSLYRMFLA